MTLPPQTLSDAGTTVTSLAVRPSPDGMAGRSPLRVDWAVTSTTAREQLGYELQASPSTAFVQNVSSSGPREETDQLDLATPGPPLRSREVRHLRVRVATEHGWSAWSPTTTVEAGLLDPTDWTAVTVTLGEDPGAQRQAPAPLLRTTFDLPAAPVRARLHVTSLGDHEVRINGRRVGDHLLDPGWTSYRSRLLVVTHDVTDLLTGGDNVLAGVLGDGWYRGRIGWDPEDDRGRYGRQLGLLAQLEVELPDGARMVVATDESWRASTGEIRSADHYDGCTVDLRRAPAGLGHGPASTTAPGRRWPWCPSTWPSSSRRWRLRSGSSRRCARRSCSAPTPKGRHCSTRARTWPGASASPFVASPVTRSRSGTPRCSSRTARCTPDRSGAPRPPTPTSWRTRTPSPSSPRSRSTGSATPRSSATRRWFPPRSLAVSSDTPVRASFSCSDADLTRFHENVRWSQRDNFVAVPTDCPQRDERLGWTGDAQAFAATACTLYDARAFWASWLVDLAHDQAADGGVPSVVPNILGDGELALGRAGWADAATIVPWSVHVAYRDREVLARQLPSMKAHVTTSGQAPRRRRPARRRVPVR